MALFQGVPLDCFPSVTSTILATSLVKSLGVVYSIFRVDLVLVGQAAASSSGFRVASSGAGLVVRARVRTSRDR